MPLISRGRPLASDAQVLDFTDHPELTASSRWGRRPRRGPVRAIVIHGVTPDGQPLRRSVVQRVVAEPPSSPGAGRSLIASWARPGRFFGAHVLLDTDAAYCCADLALDATFHTSGCNDHSVAVVIVFRKDGNMNLGQALALGAVVEAISGEFAIPRRVAAPFRGTRRDALSEDGVIGHRDAIADAQITDPGDLPAQILIAAGWRPF